MKKNIWIVLCSSGIGGAERRALKLAICLAEQNKYNVNVLLNRDLLSYFENDIQINEAINRKNFTIKIAEDYHKKLIDYKHFFGVIKKIDAYHSILRRIPFLYRLLLDYFSYSKVYNAINFKKSDIIHCFSTDAVRLGLINCKSIEKNTVIVELVGNKFLNRYANQIAITRYNPKRTFFKAVSENVLNNFNKALYKSKIKDLKNISIWDGPFIYIPKTIESIDKENTIIFASRFNQPKNPILFAEVINDIFNNNELKSWNVIIRGRGALEEEINQILYDHVLNRRVDIGFSGELYKDFLGSKVMVSIISTGNYPSQSLFEGLSYGVVPIISNTGNSIEKYNHPNVVFCELNFNDLRDKIIKTCLEIEGDSHLSNVKSRSLQEFSNKLTQGSNYLMELYQIYDA